MTDKPAQLTRADVERLSKQGSHAEIDQARIDGRLDDILGIVRHHPPATGQWTADDLTAMYRERRHNEIAAARSRGQLAALVQPTLESENTS